MLGIIVVVRRARIELDRALEVDAGIIEEAHGVVPSESPGMTSIRSAEGNWPRIETVAGRLVERKGLLVAIGLGGGEDRVFDQLGRLAADLGRTRMCPFDLGFAWSEPLTWGFRWRDPNVIERKG